MIYFQTLKNNTMKTLFYLLFIGTLILVQLKSGNAQTATLIDSVVADIAPEPGPNQLELNISLRFYVSSSSGVDAIHIKAGTQEGGSELYEAEISGSTLSATYSNGVYDINLGHFAIVPAFVEAYLVYQSGGTSAVKRRQLVD
jgi:hypothetical protein